MLDLSLLEVIIQARQTYGVRSHDYNRYASHCAAKVAYLRKSAGLQQVSNPGRKGGDPKFKKKQIIETNASDKSLLIQLFDAERAWAQSQHLKSTINNSDNPSQAKHQANKRLAKAAAHAQALASLAQQLAQLPTDHRRLPPAQVAQTVAYSLLIKGTLAFQTNKHQDGLAALALAHDLLSRLAAAAGSAQDEARANEVIDQVEPMLRFCAYELGLDTSRGFDALVKEQLDGGAKEQVEGYDALVEGLSSAAGAEASGSKDKVELTWRGKKVPVRSAQLVEVVGKVEAALAGLSEAKSGKGIGAKRMGAFDKALAVLAEGEEVAREIKDANKNSSSSALAHAYLAYHLLAVRVRRDVLLIDSTKRKLHTKERAIRDAEAEVLQARGKVNPAIAKRKLDRVRAKAYPGIAKLWDAVVAGLEGVREIEQVEADGDWVTQVEGQVAKAKAERAHTLALAHALAGSFPPALAVLARAKLYAREARSLASGLDAADEGADAAEVDVLLASVPLADSAIDALDKALTADEQRLALEWHAVAGGDPDVAEELGELSLEDKVEQKKKSGVAFYDVAFNYVAAFDVEAIARRARGEADEVEEEGGEEVASEEEEEQEASTKVEADTPKKSGWGFGLFGRK